MPVCVTGMHRSGTSMVTRMLHLCGLYLGEEEDLMRPSADNPEGFWENLKFVEINEEVLNELGGGWDRPPATPDNWSGEQEILRLREKAAATVQQFAGHDPWGWKDPRNSLTMPFWKTLTPNLKLVICLRNPLEVALSLQRRNGFSYAFGLTLWKAYYERLLQATSVEDRIITHYGAYFNDADAELRRVLRFLDIAVPEEDIKRALSASSAGLRHNSFTVQHMIDANVSPVLRDFYARMCEEAGGIDTTSINGGSDTNQLGAEIGQLLQGVNDEENRKSPNEQREGPPEDRVGRLDKSALEAELLRRERSTSLAALPADATVLVVGQGEDGLLNLDGREGWHFPQSPDGETTRYPADGVAAIAHLEALRARGADYLLFPRSAMERLEQYEKFRRYLEGRYPAVVRVDGICMVFALRKSAVAEDGGVQAEFKKIIAECGSRLGRDPSILDWDTGSVLESVFPNHAVFSPLADSNRVLPYLDRSVDVVAISSPDAVVEAWRVAEAAVVTLTPAVGRGAAADADFTLSVKWMLQEKTPPPTASIVIPTYNGMTHVETCLSALMETLPSDFRGEVLVVDDASIDGTEEAMRRWISLDGRIKTLRNGENVGFIESCNRGAKAATGEFVIFLNNDTVPLSGWLSALLRTFRDHPDAGAVGGKLVYPDGTLQEAGGVIFADGSGANFGHGDREVDAPLYNYVRETDYCSGALLATRRALFEELGGFDDRYRPAYYEDVDYCFAVRESGYKVYYQPESAIVHFEGATSGTDLSTGVKRYQVVNRAKFAEKWASALKRQGPRPDHYDRQTWFVLASRGDTPVGDIESSKTTATAGGKHMSKTVQPIFVVGSGRSGTSVMTWCFGGHPNIMPLPETYWIGRVAADLGPAYDAGSARGRYSHLSAFAIEREEFHEAFGATVNDLILSHLVRKDPPQQGDARFAPDPPKERWIDGTPENSLRIPELAKMFPQAKFVHILRDVESVVRSLMNFSRVGGGEYTEQTSYEYWLRMVRACVQAEDDLGPETVMRIRYADLVDSPESTLKSCLEFVGEDFHAACLTPLQTKINSSNVSSDFDPKERGTDPRIREEAESLSRELLAETRVRAG